MITEMNYFFFICMIVCFTLFIRGGNLLYVLIVVTLLFCHQYLKVCERSLSGSGAGPNVAAASQFVRGEMLPSGYLIRPCEGGGSIIHIVDHLNLEVCPL